MAMSSRKEKSLDEIDLKKVLKCRSSACFARVKALNLSGRDRAFWVTSGFQRLNQFRSLVELNLSYNGLKSLEGIEVLRQLTVLDCSHNLLATLDWSKQCTLLKELNCSNNRLKDLSEFNFLTELKHLTSVSIDVNPVTLTPHCRQYIAFVCPWIQRVGGLRVTESDRGVGKRCFADTPARHLLLELDREKKKSESLQAEVALSTLKVDELTAVAEKSGNVAKQALAKQDSLHLQEKIASSLLDQRSRQVTALSLQLTELQLERDRMSKQPHVPTSSAGDGVGEEGENEVELLQEACNKLKNSVETTEKRLNAYNVQLTTLDDCIESGLVDGGSSESDSSILGLEQQKLRVLERKQAEQKTLKNTSSFYLRLQDRLETLTKTIVESPSDSEMPTISEQQRQTGQYLAEISFLELSTEHTPPSVNASMKPRLEYLGNLLRARQQRLCGEQALLEAETAAKSPPQSEVVPIPPSSGHSGSREKFENTGEDESLDNVSVFLEEMSGSSSANSASSPAAQLFAPAAPVRFSWTADDENCSGIDECDDYDGDSIRFETETSPVEQVEDCCQTELPEVLNESRASQTDVVDEVALRKLETGLNASRSSQTDCAPLAPPAETAEVQSQTMVVLNSSQLSQTDHSLDRFSSQTEELVEKGSLSLNDVIDALNTSRTTQTELAELESAVSSQFSQTTSLNGVRNSHCQTGAMSISSQYSQTDARTRVDLRNSHCQTGVVPIASQCSQTDPRVEAPLENFPSAIRAREVPCASRSMQTEIHQIAEGGCQTVTEVAVAMCQTDEVRTANHPCQTSRVACVNGGCQTELCSQRAVAAQTAVIPALATRKEEVACQVGHVAHTSNAWTNTDSKSEPLVPPDVTKETVRLQSSILALQSEEKALLELIEYREAMAAKIDSETDAKMKAIQLLDDQRQALAEEVEKLHRAKFSATERLRASESEAQTQLSLIQSRFHQQQEVCNALQRKHDDLETVLESQKAEMLELETTRSRLSTSCENVRERLESEEKEWKRMRAESNETLSQLLKRITDQRAQLVDIEGLVSKKQSELDMASNVNAQIQQLIEHRTAVEQQHEQYSSKLSSLQTALLGRKEEVAAIEAEISVRREELKALLEQCSIAKDSLSSLSFKRDSLVSEHHKVSLALSQAEHEVSTIEARISAYSSDQQIIKAEAIINQAASCKLEIESLLLNKASLKAEVEALRQEQQAERLALQTQSVKLQDIARRHADHMEESNKLSIHISKLRQEKMELEEQQQVERSSRDEWHRQCLAMKQESEESTRREERLKRDCSAVKSDIEDLSKQRDRFSKEKQALLRELEVLRGQKGGFLEAIQSSKAEIDEVVRKKDRLVQAAKIELDGIALQRDRYSKESKSVKEAVDALWEEKERVSRDCRALLQEVDELSREKDRLGHVKHELEQYSRQKEGVARDVETLKAELDGLSRQRDRYGADIQSAKNELDDLVRRRDRAAFVKRELDELLLQKERLDRECRDLNTESEAHRRGKEEFIAEQRSVDAELKQLMRKRDAVRDELAALQKQSEANELNALLKERQLLTTDSAFVKDELDSLRKQSFRIVRDSDDKDVRALQKQLLEAKEELDSLRKQAVRSGRDSDDKGVRALQKQLLEAKEELDSLRNQAACNSDRQLAQALKQELEESSRREERLKRDCSAVKSDIEDQRDRFSKEKQALQRELEVLKRSQLDGKSDSQLGSQRSALQSSVHALSAERETLKRELREATEELNTVKESIEVQLSQLSDIDAKCDRKAQELEQTSDQVLQTSKQLLQNTESLSSVKLALQEATEQKTLLEVDAAELSRVSDNLSSAKHKLKGVLGKLESRKSELESVNSSLQAQQKRVAELKAEIHSLEAERATLRTAVLRVEKTVSSAKQQCTRLESDTVRLSEQREQLKKEIDSLGKSRDQSRAEVEKAKDLANQARNEIQEELSRLNIEFSAEQLSIDGQLEQLHQKRASGLDSSRELARQYGNMICMLKEDLQATLGKKMAVLAGVERIQSTRSALVDEIRGLSHSREKLVLEKEGLESAISADRNTLMKLNDSISGAQDDVVGFLHHLEKQKAQAIAIEQCITERKAELARLDESLKTGQGAADVLSSTSELEAELESVNSSLQAQQERVAQLKAEIHSLEAERATLRTAVLRVEKTVSSAKQQCTQLESDTVRLSEQKEQLKKEIDSLEHVKISSAKAKATVDGLQEQLRRRDDQLVSLAAELRKRKQQEKAPSSSSSVSVATMTPQTIFNTRSAEEGSATPQRVAPLLFSTPSPPGANVMQPTTSPERPRAAIGTAQSSVSVQTATSASCSRKKEIVRHGDDLSRPLVDTSRFYKHTAEYQAVTPQKERVLERLMKEKGIL